MLRILFYIAAIVACVLILPCFFTSIDCFIDWKKWPEFKFNLKGSILCFVLMLSLAVFTIYAFRGLNHRDLSDFKYETTCESVLHKVEVIDILQEKDKESKYVLYINNNTVTVSEDIYNQYIGNENNAITVDEASIKLYIGKPFPFGIKTQFATDSCFMIFGIDTINQVKTLYPWEENAKSYTEEDAKELALSYIEKGGNVNPSQCFKSSELKELKTISE